MRLDSLLGHRLGHALRVSALELSGQEVSEPTFEQWGDSAHEEEPDAPPRGPESAPWSFSDRSLKKIIKH